ncbi:invasion associated locus B family protein [Phyllobacterium sp. CCNWLW109]|uniref:invasion associated locus B family protein n=1 Tax=Phyllobacterium sp. CCNWLW109 TaxID=3127479 RepID=UPI003077CEBC
MLPKVLVDADRRVTGVGDGIANNDAVNKGQLDVVKTTADAAKVGADAATTKLAGLLDGESNFVFSWSLAADDKGNPAMIMRVPATVGEGKEITLAFPSRKEKVSMTVRGCTPTNCLAYLPVGPVLRQEISKGGAARISFKTDATAVDLQLPLDGLGKALGAI